MENVANICAFVKPKNIKNGLDYEIMLASHDWSLERSEEQGASGVVIKMKCKKCGTDRLSILSATNMTR